MPDYYSSFSGEEMDNADTLSHSHNNKSDLDLYSNADALLRDSKITQLETSVESIVDDNTSRDGEIAQLETATVAISEAFASHVSDDQTRWQQYLDTDEQLQQIKIQLNHILSGDVSKHLDTTTTDIEEMSSTGYTVTNPLGGQINGKAGTYLLVGTGRIWINDVLVFDNASITVGIGSKSYIQDVNQNDVIKSEALTSLTYTDYVANA